MNEGKIISIVNQKGGVAKTTSALAIAHSLAMHFNKKVLLIDIDPQGNASSMFSDMINPKKTIYEVLIQKNHINDVILKTNTNNLHIVPSNGNLSAIQTELINEYSRETRLKNSLEKIKNKYDFIILDCPPSLSLLTINALTASNFAMIPMIGETFSLEGFLGLFESIEKIKEYLNEDLEILGIFLTLFDTRSKIHKVFFDMINEKMGNYMFQTVIPRNVSIAEASNHYKNIFDYKEKSVGSESYNNLTKEMLEKLGLNNIENSFGKEKNNTDNIEEEVSENE